MSQKLAAVAEKVRARYAALEDAPGSAFHESTIHDTGLSKHLVAPQHQRNDLADGKKWPKASEHLVHFSGIDEIHFVGSDAMQAHAAIQARVAALQEIYDKGGYLDGTDRTVLQHGRRLTLTGGDGSPHLTIPRQLWNDFIHALHSQNVGLHGVTLDHAGEPKLNEKGLPA